MRSWFALLLLLSLAVTIASKHRPARPEPLDDSAVLADSYEIARRSFNDQFRSASTEHDRAAIIERAVFLYSLLVDTEASAFKQRMAIPILRAALNRDLPRELRAQLIYFLALRLKYRAQSDPSRPLEDSIADSDEATRLLEQLRAEAADLRFFGISTARKVEPMIAELRQVGIGRRAPEVFGKDDAGRTIRLSDYRGEVVALFFWADWCPLCRQGYEGDRRIVAGLKGKPFVMIGVNGDDSPKTMRTVVRRNQLNWPSIWQAPEGSLTETWFVSPWPALYLIDARGIIRYNNGKHRPIDHKALAAAVDVLLDEQARGTLHSVSRRDRFDEDSAAAELLP